MRTISLTVACLLIFCVGCDSDDAPVEEISIRGIFFQLIDMPALTNDYHYEGWVHINQENFSVGKFLVDNGNPVTLDGLPLVAGRFDTNFNLDSTQYVFITIEPPQDTDDVPSQTRLMGGVIQEGNRAQLAVTNFEGLEDGLINSSGSYVLFSPTNGPDTDETSGIWFMNLTGGGPGRGLLIPNPLVGWNFQGWVRAEGGALSTGIITNPATDDLSNPYVGPMATPGFPGEDFLNNPPPNVTFPLGLESADVYISLEPDPDPDPESRFPLVLLSAKVSSEPTTDSTYAMQRSMTGFPSGIATLASPQR